MNKFNSLIISYYSTHYYYGDIFLCKKSMVYDNNTVTQCLCLCVCLVFFIIISINSFECYDSMMMMMIKSVNAIYSWSSLHSHVIIAIIIEKERKKNILLSLLLHWRIFSFLKLMLITTFVVVKNSNISQALCQRKKEEKKEWKCIKNKYNRHMGFLFFFSLIKFFMYVGVWISNITIVYDNENINSK